MVRTPPGGHRQWHVHASPYTNTRTRETWLADTLVVVGKLDTVQAAGRAARVRAALVNIPLAALAGEAGRAVTPVPPDLIHASAIVEALGCPPEPRGGTAVILIYLAQDT